MAHYLTEGLLYVFSLEKERPIFYLPSSGLVSAAVPVKGSAVSMIISSL